MSSKTDAQEEALCEDNLPDLCNDLDPVASKCKIFGLQLHVPNNVIDTIQKDKCSCKEQLCEILAYRLKQMPPLTWQAVVAALMSNSMKENKLANDIRRRRYLSNRSESIEEVDIHCGPSNKKVCINTPITQFIEYVKDIYRRNVVGDRKNTKWQILSSEVFINLAVIGHQYTTSKDAEEYTKAMIQDGNIDKILGQKGHIEFSDIAKDSPQNRIVIVEGAPGVGKTTFAWEFCSRWERGEIAQQYQLVLLIRLRDERMSRATSLRDIFHYPEQSVLEAVEKEITKSCGANILEGFDELPDHCRHDSIFMQLINGEVIHKATVLITSRPWATGVILSDNRDRIYQRIEILGFTKSQIEEYISSAFNGRNDADNSSAYLRTYRQIKASMYIPLNSAIAVAVYMDSKKNEYTAPRTLRELYYG